MCSFFKLTRQVSLSAYLFCIKNYLDENWGLGLFVIDEVLFLLCKKNRLNFSLIRCICVGA